MGKFPGIDENNPGHWLWCHCRSTNTYNGFTCGKNPTVFVATGSGGPGHVTCMCKEHERELVRGIECEMCKGSGLVYKSLEEMIRLGYIKKV